MAFSDSEMLISLFNKLDLCPRPLRSQDEEFKQALALQEEHKPYLLCGSPPCSAFSALQKLCDARRSPAENEWVRAQGRKHLHNSIR
eukprot:3422242-Amphidinium_carterae.1